MEKSVLDELYAIRVFDKIKGPLISALQFSENEIINHFAHITDIDINEAIRTRIRNEKMIRKLFIQKGGHPKTEYALYFAVGYHVLDFFVEAFEHPAYIKIPLSYFKEKPVSFLYGSPYISFFRRDRHKTAQKVFRYDELEQVIIQHGIDVEYDEKKSCIEMHLWDPSAVQEYHQFYYEV